MVLLFNAVIFVMVAVVLIKHVMGDVKRGGKPEKKKVAKATIKSIVGLVSVMTLFGLSWLFGALNVGKASIVFQWFFVLLNAFQGFFLFIFFCIIGKDARDEWKDLFMFVRRDTLTSTFRTHIKQGHNAETPSTKKTDLSSKDYSLDSKHGSFGLVSDVTGKQNDPSRNIAKEPTVKSTNPTDEQNTDFGTEIMAINNEDKSDIGELNNGTLDDKEFGIHDSTVDNFEEPTMSLASTTETEIKPAMSHSDHHDSVSTPSDPQADFDTEP